MPYNGSGVFQRIYNWVTDATNGIPITPARFDADENDIAAGLSNCITRNGQSPPLTNLPMGGFKFTGLLAGTVAGDAITFDQLGANGGAALTGFLQFGTGAVLRTVQAELRDSVSVKQFGAVGDNVTDDTAAIQAANAAAIASNKKLYFPNPSVAYKYSPAGPISIQHWEGEDQYATVINVVNAYAGEVVRVLANGSLENLTIQTPGLTKTAGSIGVRVAAPAIKDLNVNTELRRIFVRGFDKSIDLQNVYVLHADHVHVESSNYGIYCVPDATTYGYITTHTWVNCDFGNNGINVYYNSPNYSNTVTFVGGNISGATGLYQSYFNKLRIIKFINFYFEASSTIRAVYLNDVDYLSFDGGYFNSTGGIQVGSGSANRIEMRNIWCTSATDILTGADGNQMVSLHSCTLPGAGSSALALWKTLTLENTSYNNVFYASLARGQSFGFKDNSQAGGGTTTIDMNGGNEQRITVTDTAAFTVGAPANATAGQTIDLTIQNSSGGGVLGVITWNAVFKLAGWASPASGFNRTIQFRFDGSSWHMKAPPMTTDIAN